MQTTYHRHNIRLIAFMTALLIPLTALASGTATVESNGQTSKLYWQDDGALRMGMGQKDGYAIIRDGKTYSVTSDDGSPVVMDISGMMQAFAGMAGDAADSQSPFGSIDAVKTTGASETVAGIKGQVYQITVTDAQGATRTMETVLTDDPLVREMTRAYITGIATMFGSDQIETQFLGKLPADKQGLLRSGEDFKLVSISDKKPSADVFKLPAQPTSLGNMMQKALEGMQN